jgi:hypothetical protein
MRKQTARLGNEKLEVNKRQSLKSFLALLNSSFKELIVSSLFFRPALKDDAVCTLIYVMAGPPMFPFELFYTSGFANKKGGIALTPVLIPQ